MPEDTNPFITLGLQPAYRIDDAELEAAFVRASSAAHPDRFTDPLEQAEAAEKQAAISDAYHTLADPMRRAAALLEIAGESSHQGESHGGTPGETSEGAELPPDLLMEVMELREEMETAIADEDHATLQRLHDWAAEQMQASLDRVAAAFDEHLNSATMNTTPDSLGPLVRRHLNAARYFRRIIEQMPE